LLGRVRFIAVDECDRLPLLKPVVRFIAAPVRFPFDIGEVPDRIAFAVCFAMVILQRVTTV
jgi:hypothetical protein